MDKVLLANAKDEQTQIINMLLLPEKPCSKFAVLILMLINSSGWVLLHECAILVQPEWDIHHPSQGKEQSIIRFWFKLPITGWIQAAFPPNFSQFPSPHYSLCLTHLRQCNTFLFHHQKSWLDPTPFLQTLVIKLHLTQKLVFCNSNSTSFVILTVPF